MPIPIRMCDERLAEFVDVYGYWSVPMKDISTFSPGLIAFNPTGTYLEVDGEQRREPVVMGIANDPMHIRYTIGEGWILSLRIRAGTYDRLFDMDPSAQSGVVGLDPDRHPRLAAVYERLKSAGPDPETLFATLDDALCAMLPDAKPPGLIDDMTRIVFESDRDWTVAELADALGCTVRTLERACKRRYGRTPKRLLRARRLFRTRRLEGEVDERIELQPEFAYADLPHYLNDLRRLVGLNRAQLGDDTVLGLDYPYRYLWPDGSEAETSEDIQAWQEEMARRIREYPG